MGVGEAAGLEGLGTMVTADDVARFREDGVVHLAGALDQKWVQSLEAAHARHIAAGGQMWRWREFPEYLEFVPGSHRGVLHNGFSYDPKQLAEDETAPLFRESDLPRLPAIEADRASWDIVSWAITPGDLVVFHPGLLHGGAPIVQSQR